jgi:hypothetical protein
VKEQASSVFLLWGSNSTTVEGDRFTRSNVHISEFVNHDSTMSSSSTCPANAEDQDPEGGCRKFLYHFGPLSAMPADIVDSFPQQPWLEVGAKTYAEKVGSSGAPSEPVGNIHSSPPPPLSQCP